MCKMRRRNEEWRIRFSFCVEASTEWKKEKKVGGRWRKFNARKFWIDDQVLIHWMGKGEESGGKWRKFNANGGASKFWIDDQVLIH